MSTTRISRLVTPIVVLAVAVVSAAACSSPSKTKIASVSGTTAAPPSASSSPSLSMAETAHKFGQCMRDHGITMDDPKVSSGGELMIQLPGGAGSDVASMTKAQKACQIYLPNGGQPTALDPKALEQIRKFAKCMRDHGVNMPDPSSNGQMQFGAASPGATNQGNGVGGLSPDDPTFKAAQTACQSLMPGGGSVQSGSGT